MEKVLEINNLDYQDFHNLNIGFDSGKFYSIIGGSNSGKTTLFKLMASLIPTNDMITCNNTYLHDDNPLEYLVNVGIVERVNNSSFLYHKVIDEMKYPLYNLGYSKSEILERINEVLELFEVSYFLDKNVSMLNNLEKQLLLIIISILHKPKVLLLDSVLEIYPVYEQEKIIKKLKRLIKDGLTVINFTKSLELINESDSLILLDSFNIVGEYLPSKVYEDDKLFYSHNLEIPFLTDLSIKLKMYNLVSKDYHDMKEMVDDIWP